MTERIFKYKIIYFIAILFSFFGIGLFGYTTITKILRFNQYGFMNDDVIYFPLNIIAVISFIASLLLLIRRSLFSIKILNVGIATFCCLIILGIIKLFMKNEAIFRFLFLNVFFLILNIILMVVFNKYKISPKCKLVTQEIESIGKIDD